MNRAIIIFAIFILATSFAHAQSADPFADQTLGSSLLKPTLKVGCVKDVNYWKQPAAKNFWSWMPKLRFMVSGPIDDGSFLTYEFFTPDGKPWFKTDSDPFGIAAGGARAFESEAVPRWTDKRSTIQTGVFSFKITLNNTLQGTSKPFYAGRFKVSKVFAGTPLPDFKNQYLFYVEQDWMLPMAYLKFDASEDADAPVFKAAMWFRGQFNGRIKAYLFHNGKQVSNTEVGGSLQTDYVFIDGDDENKYRWEQWTFNFYNARRFDRVGGNATYHVFKNRPGSYEIKVLIDGELVRAAAFTVDTEGSIVDNGIARSNGLQGFGIVVPAKILPIKEGAVDPLQYKTEGFYGNPLIGF